MNGVLRNGHFSDFLGDKTANLGLIDFKIGLYVKVSVNKRQNKCEDNISKYLAKMVQNRPDAKKYKLK